MYSYIVCGLNQYISGRLVYGLIAMSDTPITVLNIYMNLFVSFLGKSKLFLKYYSKTKIFFKFHQIFLTKDSLF